MIPFRKQKGSAIISALLVVSVVTVLTVGMLSRQNIEIRRAENIFSQDRLQNQIVWVELWAKALLQTVSNQLNEEDYITLDQVWTQPLTEFHREGMWVSGEIIDLQSFFNINNITVKPLSDEEKEVLEDDDKEAPTNKPTKDKIDSDKEKTTTPADLLTDKNNYTAAWAFTRLLENNAKLNKNEARALTEMLLYWLLPEMSEQDKIYMDFPQPYQAAHRPFFSVSEIRLVNGMNNVIYDAIAPFVAVATFSDTLKISSEAVEMIPVNINTTSPEVLSALLGIDMDEARSLLNVRPYYTEEALQEQIQKLRLEPNQMGSALSLLSVTSEFFLVKALVRDDKRELVQYSILQREPGGEVQILGRIRGEL